MIAMARRLSVAAASTAVLLGIPAAAGAELVISGSSPAPGGSGSTTIAFEGAVPAGLVVYVPPGFRTRLAHAPGTKLGRASAALDLRGSTIEAAGPIVSDDPARAACGTAGHEAVWRLSLAGAPSELLVAVDAVGPGEPDAAYASYRLAFCPDGGILVRSVELRVEEVFANPSTPGAYAWRAVATPADAAGAPNPGAAVESRSTQLLPVRLTLRGTFDAAEGSATLTGTVTAGGTALPGARVEIAAGRSASSLVRAGAATTGTDGRFQERRSITEATVFQASAEMQGRGDPAGCPAPIAAGGCAGATLAPLPTVSDRVTVRVPALRVLRLGSRGAEVRRLRARLSSLRFLAPSSQAAAFDDRTWHAVVALQGWLRLPRTGVVDRRTWRALAGARVPLPWAPLRRGVLIDTARQVLLLVDGGRTVRAIHVSTGAYGRTPRGRFSVYRKETLSWSVPFSVWMPYASYFNGGFAMHAYSSVPTYPASHGCVRVPPIEAPFVYRFAGYGTPVWIR
jgi:hypothetical protein